MVVTHMYSTYAPTSIQGYWIVGKPLTVDIVMRYVDPCSSCQPVDEHILHHRSLVDRAKCRKDIQQDYHCTALC